MNDTVGIAFSRRADGDLRSDLDARRHWAERNGAPTEWATVDQVHGAVVAHVSTGGAAGSADGLVTASPGLGVAVFTADCAGIVVAGRGGAGIAHAGWRGARSGIVGALLEKMDRLGMEPLEAHLGPVIGPCCFEVGPDVAAHFPGFVSTTTWGTTSVDLTGFLRAEIGSLPLHTHGGCTFHDDEYWSHRRTKDPARMAAVGWIRE